VKFGSKLNSIQQMIMFLARYVVLHAACTLVDAFLLQFIAHDKVSYSIIPAQSVHACL